MPSEKAIRILRSKSDLTDEQIALLSEADAWNLIYTKNPPKNSRSRHRNTEICFTGFQDGEKDRLSQIAEVSGLVVVKSVTKTLTFLVTGRNAGPSKLKKAEDQQALILTEEQFMRFLDDGTVPGFSG